MPSRSFCRSAGAAVDLGQVRAVVQHPDRLEDQVRLDPGQQMRPPLAHLGDGLVAEEVAVPQQQHVLLEEPQQVVGHGDLAAGLRLDQEAPQHMAAGLAQGQDAGLGERGGARPLPGRPNARSLAGVSGTSTTNPSRAMVRMPR